MVLALIERVVNFHFVSEKNLRSNSRGKTRLSFLVDRRPPMIRSLYLLRWLDKSSVLSSFEVGSNLVRSCYSI
jgi:hypothetical protein